MSKGKIAFGTLLGAAGGFIAGILSAPKSGKETRDSVKDAARKVRDNVVDEAEKIKTVATEKAEQAKAKATDVADEASVFANNLKGRAEQAIDGAKKGFAQDPQVKDSKKPAAKTKK